MTTTVERPETAADPRAATGRHSPAERAATAQRTPTEVEIRAAIQAALDSSDIDIGTWVHDLGLPLDPDGGVLWADLRGSEAEVLSDLLNAVYVQADAIEAEAVTRITELLVYAAMEFARRYPDAPRAPREAVTA